MVSQVDLSIIIPAYNEQRIITQTIREISDTFDGVFPVYEVIVVDDGSDDRTAEIVEGIKNPDIRLIRHGENRGKGRAVKTGMLAAQGTMRLFTDADGSTSITHFFDFLPYMNDYDLIIGSRALPESIILVDQPFYRRLLGRCAGGAIRKMLNLNYRDMQCGFKLLTAEAAEKLFPRIQCDGWGFDFELLKMAQIENMRVIELPVTWENEPESKVSILDYPKTLKSLLYIRKEFNGR